MAAIVELHGVTKQYRVDGKDVTALDGIDITVERGEIFAIIGYSGAGKSTLVRLVNALGRHAGKGRDLLLPRQPKLESGSLNRQSEERPGVDEHAGQPGMVRARRATGFRGAPPEKSAGRPTVEDGRVGGSRRVIPRPEES